MGENVWDSPTEEGRARRELSVIEEREASVSPASPVVAQGNRVLENGDGGRGDPLVEPESFDNPAKPTNGDKELEPDRRVEEEDDADRPTVDDGTPRTSPELPPPSQLVEG